MHRSTLKTSLFAALGLGLCSSMLAEAGELRVVRLSKAELEQAGENNFIRARDLSDVLSSNLKLLIVTVTQRQSGNNVAMRDVVSQNIQPSKSLWMKRLSTLAFDPESNATRGHEQRLRLALTGQSRSAAESKIKENLPILEKIRNGMNFNLDLRNPGQSLGGKNQRPEIRYGLVESDILPSERTIPVATLGEMSDIDARYASPARVVYTIDRITGEPTKAVFAASGQEEQAVQSTSVWNKAPSTNVKIKIDSSDRDGSVSEKIGQGALPGARVRFIQADGFVTTQFVADGRRDARKSLTTELKAPLYGEMSLSQTFDYKMRLMQTSALNILGDSSLPRFNLLYAHHTKKAKGEWILRQGTLECSVVAEPRQGWAPGTSKTLGKPGDKVSVNFNKTF